MAGKVSVKIYRGIGITFILFLLVFVVLLLTAVYIYTHKSQPQARGEIVVKGIERPVVIVRDGRDIPHLYAAGGRDLFFAAGFVQAQDRLFQMDLYRRAAQGRLAEWFGPSALPSDRLARTIGFYRIAEKNLLNAPPESLEALESFQKGVNALVTRRGRNLPIEYSRLRSSFEPWKEEDSLAIAAYFAWKESAGFRSELVRLAALEKLGDEKGMELLRAGVPDEGGIPLGGAAYKRPPESVLAIGDLKALLEADAALRSAGQLEAWQGISSSALAIGGSRTAGGSPILYISLDSEMTLPNPWYAMHLSGGGMNALGVTHPGLPYIINGRSEKTAWAAVPSRADNQDVYLEKIDPATGRYARGDSWEEFSAVEEKIFAYDPARKGLEGHDFKFRVGRHGPVLNDALEKADGGARYFLCLKWTGREATDPVGAFIQAASSPDKGSFLSASRREGCPAREWIFADSEGNYGWQLSGLVPVRSRHDGALPVPGWTGDFEWQGYVPSTELPGAFNPEEGMVVLANGPVRCPGPFVYSISRDFDERGREDRLKELLGEGRDEKEKRPLDIKSLSKALRDPLSTRALKTLPLLMGAMEGRTSEDETLDRTYLQLKDWKGEMEVDSSAALIFSKTMDGMGRRLLEDDLGPELYEVFSRESLSIPLIDGILLNKIEYFIDDKKTDDIESPDDIILWALGSAVAEITTDHGARMSTWKWGDVQVLDLRHPLAMTGEIRKAAGMLSVNVSPFPLPGGQGSIFGGYNSSGGDYRVTSGTNLFFASDLDVSETTLTSYPGGQSGQPFSPYYADMLKAWPGGEGPVLMDRAKVEDSMSGRLSLLPHEPASGKI